MYLVCKKLGYSLFQDDKTNKKIFEVIKKKIPNTLFSILSYPFFSFIVKKKLVDIFIIKKNNKLVSILTFIKAKKLLQIKKKILIFFLKNPHIFFLNFIFILKSLSRTNVSFFNNINYAHLLHLIIFKNTFTNVGILTKDIIFNYFFKLILKKYNAKNIFLCYEVRNIRAHKFYKRNKFKIFYRNKKIVFVKKLI